MLPVIVNLKIISPGKFRLKLWLPVIILWPFALVIFLFFLPVLLVADIVLKICGIDMKLFRLASAIAAVFSALCGTRIYVNSPSKNTEIRIAII
jgi:hypothetical protein